MEDETVKNGIKISPLLDSIRIFMTSIIAAVVILIALVSGYYISETYRLLSLARNSEIADTIFKQNAFINVSTLYCLLAILFLVGGSIIIRGLYWIIGKIKIERNK